MLQQALGSTTTLMVFPFAVLCGEANAIPARRINTYPDCTRTTQPSRFSWTSSCQRLDKIIMTQAPQGSLLYFGIGAFDGYPISSHPAS